MPQDRRRLPIGHDLNQVAKAADLPQQLPTRKAFEETR
jgi:hypothetical protein